MTELVLDFETRCVLDIEERGLDNYARQAEALMLGWAIDDDKIEMWFPAKGPMPSRLSAALLDPTVIKIAWNASFERLILRYFHKMEIPINQWRDPSILARSMSMPGKLESVCEIWKLGKDQAKIADGKRLIKLFSIPNGEEIGEETEFGPSTGFNEPAHFPQDWDLFVEYCRRDVEVERLLWLQMQKFAFPEEQWEDWFLDQEMNDFGMPFNVERARKALALAEKYKKQSKDKMNAMTGLENANSVKQLLPWVEERGYAWGSLNKNFVEFELKNPNSKLTPEAREVLTLRRKSAQNSYTKLENMLNQVGPDGRVRYLFWYLGAARTGRWSSPIQNMPRPIKKIEKMLEEGREGEIFKWIDNEDYEGILKEFEGSTLPFVASIIRMMFQV